MHKLHHVFASYVKLIEVTHDVIKKVFKILKSCPHINPDMSDISTSFQLVNNLILSYPRIIANDSSLEK